MLDVTITPPETWENRSMISYHAPEETDSGISVNLIVTESVLDPAPALDDAAHIAMYTDAQLSSLTNSLPQFELLARTPLTVTQRPAVQLECRWMSAEMPLQQAITFIRKNADRALIMTATAHPDDFDRYRPQFEQALYSLTF